MQSYGADGSRNTGDAGDCLRAAVACVPAPFPMVTG